MVHLEPLAAWCEADYVEKRVHKVDADKKQIVFEDGGSMSYDVLALNVGSRTRGANEVKGVWEHSLTTRPINDLLGKIEAKESQLIKDGVIPTIAVCGSGAAGIELSFAFKNRWSKLFGRDIKTQLLCSDSDIMRWESDSVRELTKAKLREHNIDVVMDARIDHVEAGGVVLKDGRRIEANVPVWATGAEAQKVTVRSNLAILDNYFRVNDYLQSTSHPDVFGGGDCITMETYSHTVHPDRPNKVFPPKAGVYAVRAGPMMA